MNLFLLMTNRNCHEHKNRFDLIKSSLRLKLVALRFYNVRGNRMLNFHRRAFRSLLVSSQTTW